MKETLSDDALEFATKKHFGVNRRGGEEYISHPKAVADTVKSVKGNSHAIEDLLSAAYLHDTVEDTDTSYEEILKNFGPTVTSLVHELTSDEEALKKYGKTDYLKKKLSGISSWALVIKLADRLHNVSDLATADIKWATKYALQTRDILEFVKKSRQLTSTHKKLVKMIEDIINKFL